MPSQKSTDVRRKPQRQRGHERVAALLDAAGACFVEKGYEGTTMTEVAARAGAAIGSLYQFFPTKEALARALLEEYAQAAYEALGKFADKAADWSTEEWAEQLCAFLITIRKRYPAFVPLVESVPKPAADGLNIRRRLRAQLQSVLARRAPHRSDEETYAAAVVVQQMMKGAAAIQAEPGMPGRQAALAQMQHAMQRYLHGVFAA
ncbi:TetR/AcrR family transcriptional regulator [Dyella monticola]|nr:TetR/AcrR family transcriptional regulator [Dyella monticola]